MNIDIIKKFGRKIIPSVRLRRLIKHPFRVLKPAYNKYLISTAEIRHKRALQRVKKKKTIKVAFFVIHSSVWKYDGLYRLLEKDDRLEPIVVICPYIVQGEKTMFKEMMMAENLFRRKKYNFVTTYIKNSGTWLDVKDVINPDIVFFTNPHNLTKEQYYIMNYINQLTCYIPYSFQVSNLYEMQFNQIFHKLLWKQFYETSIHKNIARQYSSIKDRNVIVTGYPGVDAFFDKNYKCIENQWKIKDGKIKRIIWAPHHTIDEDNDVLNYSTFLFYADFMLEVAHKYCGQIQIAFKPHPLLKAKLENEKFWGKQKTDDYYQKWRNLKNGQLNESTYTDLFMTSDALIHDSGSFLAEYIATRKPALYLMHDKQITDRFNEFGKLAFDTLYHATSKKEVISFIEDVVINKNDFMKKNREDFIDKYMVQSKNNITASENIYRELIKCVG